MTERARFGDIQQLIVENGLFSGPVIEAWKSIPRTLVLVHPNSTLPVHFAMPGYSAPDTWKGYSNVPTPRRDILDLIGNCRQEGIAVVIAEVCDIMKPTIPHVSEFPELQEAADLVVPERSVRSVFASELQDYLTAEMGHEVSFDEAQRISMLRRFEMVFARNAGQRAYILNDAARIKSGSVPDGMVLGKSITHGFEEVPFTQALTAEMLTNPSIPSYDINRKDPEALRAAILAEEDRVGASVAKEMDAVRQEVGSFFSS